MGGQRVWPVRVAALALLGLVTGCAGQTGPGVGKPAPSAAPSASAGPMTRVPTTVDKHVELVDKEFPAAGLVPLIRYEPGLLLDRGVVAVTDPPAGTSVPMGSVVRVVVAGEPVTLDDYVRAHWETFVGLTSDAKGTLVLAVHQGGGLPEVIEQAEKFTKGRAYRVVSCPRSRVELEQVRIELSRRTFLPRAADLKYSTDVDVASCALRVSADFTDAESTELTARFGAAVVIERGAAAGRGVRTGG